jgi:hypothetical protein
MQKIFTKFKKSSKTFHKTFYIFKKKYSNQIKRIKMNSKRVNLFLHIQHFFVNPQIQTKVQIQKIATSKEKRKKILDSFSGKQFQNFKYDKESIERNLINALHFFVPFLGSSIRTIGFHSKIIMEMENQSFILTVGQNEKSVESLQQM